MINKKLRVKELLVSTVIIGGILGSLSTVNADENKVRSSKTQTSSVMSSSSSSHTSQVSSTKTSSSSDDSQVSRTKSLSSIVEQQHSVSRDTTKQSTHSSATVSTRSVQIPQSKFKTGSVVTLTAATKTSNGVRLSSYANQSGVVTKATAQKHGNSNYVYNIKLDNGVVVSNVLEQGVSAFIKTNVFGINNRVEIKKNAKYNGDAKNITIYQGIGGKVTKITRFHQSSSSFYYQLTLDNGVVIDKVLEQDLQRYTNKPVHKDGWSKEDGATKYYVNGKHVVGEKKIGGHWYNFTSNGAQSKGLTKLAHKTVFYDVKSGQMKYGYVWINGSLMFFDKADGHALTGVRHYNGGVEVYSPDFKQIRNNYATVGGSKYYLTGNGDAFKGSRKTNGHLEFYGTNHVQVRNNYAWINQSLMYFDGNGYAMTGVRHYGSNMEYYDVNHKQVRNNYIRTGNTYYYMKANGDAFKGLRQYSKTGLEYYGSDFKQVRNNYATANASRYYFSHNGDAIKGTRTVKGKLEYYNTGYKQVRNNYAWINGALMFFDHNGYAMTGVRHYGSNMEYYATNHKQIRDSYVRTGNTYYYMKANGDAFKGLRHYSQTGIEYYGSDFKQVRNQSVTIGDKIYHFNKDGDSDSIKSKNLGTAKYAKGANAYIVSNADQSVNGHHDLKKYVGQNVKIIDAASEQHSHSNWKYTIKLNNGVVIKNVLEQDLQSNKVNLKVDTNKLINWFESRKGKLTYSMYGSRNGADGTADCSGSVVQAIRDAGGTPYTWLYNTEAIHDYLKENVYQLIDNNDRNGWMSKRGDIVIWGQQGHSNGGAGHIGIITNNLGNPLFISTCYITQGQKGTAVQEVLYNQYAAKNNYPYYYVYRLAQ
ncbi:enterotoxin [Leuconostoc carnosum]|uniref:peptidoglycan amidohydrolase family protein n=1 Tax=Leuconostoc TaxID=1243 RepID=UPI000D513E87|nr:MULTISPECIES: peptidoglycan amidohydrolase family protein [Leuconostoc]KAA8325545.1 enterotoxin [Leuconostoc carnosum]KAA8359767.1 enterotoxin [Leuconostoc carnosum]KAA8365342.1 enterotoxin [Leuconostoc carnosum]KAA8372904.1 enterotoxin [Leuconostoc carnosum]KAA8374388.1 enterotoxin [Leuconostoc carnosum]